MGGCLGKNKDDDKSGDKKDKNYEEVLEDIGDLKSVLTKGASLFSKTDGKPNDHYESIQNIANGALTKVKKVENKYSKCTRALKIIKKAYIDQQEDEKNFMKEIYIYRSLDHPGILKIYEFYENDKNFYLICEFCGEGDLFDKLQTQAPINEYVAAHLMRQILSSVHYCHSQNIVHRDIRPENFLVESVEKFETPEGEKEFYNVRLNDFSSARSFKKSKKLTKKVGTPCYIAPEVLKRSYNEKCDIWSCGVIFFIILCGKPPFFAETEKEILEKVENHSIYYKDEEWVYVSEEARELLSWMLTPDPSKRISIPDALNHKWFHRYLLKTPLSREQFHQFYKNIVTLKTETKFFFQHATFAYMVHHLAKKEDLADIRRLFDHFDDDGNGNLKMDEIVEGFEKVIPDLVDVKELKKILKFLDHGNTGLIEYEEFARCFIDKMRLLTDDYIETTYLMFTRGDKEKKMTPQEFKKILGINVKFSEKVWDSIIKEIDQNGDGEIEFAEFKDMMLKFTEPDRD